MIPGSEVVLLSQNPGVDEETGRRLVAYTGPRHRVYEPHPPAPLLGPTGYELGRKYLPLAGLERGKTVSLANPIRCRPDGKNELLLDATTKLAVEHCQFHYYRPPVSTQLVVAEGAVALYAATGEDGTDSPGHKISRGIEGWRGWILPWNPPPQPKRVWTSVYTPDPGDVIVLPTFHLAYLFRAPWYTPVSQRDWSKVQPVLQGKWPEPFPQVHPLPPNPWPSRFAFDTEYHEDTLVRYSVASRARGDQPVVWVVEASVHRPPDTLPSTLTVAFHHVEADLDYLMDLLRPHQVAVNIEDTMFQHAVLYADLDHDLDFVGSLYARTNRWKHLLRTNPRVYAGGDALGTLDSHIALSQELDRDPQVKKVYYEYQLPLAGVIHKARRYGLRVIPERVEQALLTMEQAQEEATFLAQSHVGWPLNLGSAAQVGRELYEIERVHLNEMGRVRHG